MWTMKEYAESPRSILWREVAAAVASSETVTAPRTCVIWADEILKAYDKRFKGQEKGGSK